MKHVVILMTNHWSATMGGAEYQAKVLTEFLVGTGRYKVTWVGRYIGPNYRPDGYEIRQLKPPRILGVYNPFPDRYSTDYFRLQKLLGDIRPDIIYQRVGCAFTGIAARYMKMHGCRVIWHVARDDDVTLEMLRLRPWNFIQAVIEKQFVRYGARHASRVVVQTRIQQELLKKYYDRSDGVLIPNFHPLPKLPIQKADIFTVAWVANFKFTKRPEEFVHLAERLSEKKNIRFVMAGAMSPVDETYIQLKVRMSALQNLTYLGQVSQEEVNDLLGRSHLFVNTSTVEGMPNTFIQSWLRKTPVLSLSVNPDGMLNKDSTGICAGSLDGLVDVVSQLSDNLGLVAHMGEQSAIFAREYFSVNNLNRLVQLIDDELASC